MNGGGEKRGLDRVPFEGERKLVKGLVSSGERGKKKHDAE